MLSPDSLSWFLGSYAILSSPPFPCAAGVSLARYLDAPSKWLLQTLKYFASVFFQHFSPRLYPHLVDHFNCLLGWPTWPNNHSDGVGVFIE